MRKESSSSIDYDQSFHKTKHPNKSLSKQRASDIIKYEPSSKTHA